MKKGKIDPSGKPDFSPEGLRKMNNGVEGLFLSWSLALILHFLKLYLDKVYNKREEMYKNDVLKNNYKKYFLESFKTYIRSLIFLKWFLIIMGIFALLRDWFL